MNPIEWRELETTPDQQTLALQVPGGCVLRFSRDADSVITDSMVFVPGVRLELDEDDHWVLIAIGGVQ